MTFPQIEKFTNALGQTRFHINYGPSIFHPGKSNFTCKKWETYSGAYKAMKGE